MSTNEATRDYKSKEEVWFDDGREEQVLEYVKAHLDPSGKNLPQSVLDLIDEFGASRHYMMNVGSRKGCIVTKLIAQHKPRTMIELGSYIGYSTVLFAGALRDNGGNEYISFERDANFARVAASMVELAGLKDIVRFVIGSSSENLVQELRNKRLVKADMVFLDHYKPAYVQDLKIMESLGAIQVGSVLVADNVIEPGNPPYLAYVRASSDQKSKWANKTALLNPAERFPDKTVHQYKKTYSADQTELLPGVPGIVYDSQLIHSYEPTGVPDGLEITICKSC